MLPMQSQRRRRSRWWRRRCGGTTSPVTCGGRCPRWRGRPGSAPSSCCRPRPPPAPRVRWPTAGVAAALGQLCPPRLLLFVKNAWKGGCSSVEAWVHGVAGR
jgi:hypothetical protein